MNTFKLYLDMNIKNENGKIVKKLHKRCSRSFVKQFLQLLQAGIAQINYLNSNSVTIKDTGGVDRSEPQGDVNMQALAETGVSTYGIFVGTGATAPTNTDYAPETQIAHGSGTGELNYQAGTYTEAQIVGSNVDFILTRTFINLSGGTIGVTESGLILSGYVGVYLCIHDVSTAINVLNAQTLTVSYTLRTTV